MYDRKHKIMMYSFLGRCDRAEGGNILNLASKHDLLSVIKARHYLMRVKKDTRQ